MDWEWSYFNCKMANGEQCHMLQATIQNVFRCNAQTEKKVLALVWTCDRFILHVCGCEFQIETDFKLLVCIFSRCSKPSAKIEHWELHLQYHNNHVVYYTVKGTIAGAFSRLHQINPKYLSSVKEDFARFKWCRNARRLPWPQRKTERVPE